MAVPVNTTIQTQIANLYIAILGRNPEPAGFAYWTDNLANNNGTAQALQNITLAFSNSPEFVATYGGQTTAAAVGLMYTNVLNRTADAGGLAYWGGIANGYIASGYTIAQAYALTGNAIATAAAANTGTADATLMATKQAAAIASGTAAPTTTYTLTTGIDTYTPSGNTIGQGTQATFQAGDTITGSGNNNTLKLVDTGSAAWVLPAANVSGIQNILIQNNNGVATGVTETATVTVAALSAGQTLTVGGQTLLATSDLSASAVASALAGTATSGTGFTLTAASTLSGWTKAAGGAGTNTVVYTSTTANAPVADLVVGGTSQTGVPQVTAFAITTAAADNGEIYWTLTYNGTTIRTNNIAGNATAATQAGEVASALNAYAGRTIATANSGEVTIVSNTTVNLGSFTPVAVDGTLATAAVSTYSSALSKQTVAISSVTSASTVTPTFVLNGVSYTADAVGTASSAIAVATSVANKINSVMGATVATTTGDATSASIVVNNGLAGVNIKSIAATNATVGSPTSTTTSSGIIAASPVSVVTVNGVTAGGFTDTVDADNFVGAQVLGTSKSTSAVAINDLVQGQAVQMDNGSGALTATYKTAATSATLNVTGGNTGGVATIAGSGLMTAATINSTGGAQTAAAGNLNTITSLTLPTTVSTLNINAATSLNTGNITATGLKTINASGLATTVQINATTGAVPNATVTTINGSGLTAGGVIATLTSAVTSFTGGAGTDTVTINTATNADAVINGGGGTGDILNLQSTSGGTAHDVTTAAKAAQYTNFEVLRNSQADNVNGTKNIDMSIFSSYTAVQSNANGAGFTNMTAAQAAAVTNRIADNNGATFSLANSSGASDVLTVTLNNGTATTGPTLAASLKTITVNGFETMNVISRSGVNGTLDTSQSQLSFTAADSLTALNISGSAPLTVSTTNLGLAIAINASAMTYAPTAGNYTLTLSGNLVKGSSVTGTNLADSITTTAQVAGAAGDFVIYNLGSGDDVISSTVAAINNTDATKASVQINGGSGVDTLTLTDTSITLTDATFQYLTGIDTIVNAATSSNAISVTTGGYFNTNFAGNPMTTLTLGAAGNTAANTVNLSTFTGNATVSLTATAATSNGQTVATGSGNDIVTLLVGDGTASSSVNLGAGNDSLAMTMKTSGVTTHLVNGGAGQDSIVFTGATAQSSSANVSYVVNAGQSTITAYDSVTGAALNANSGSLYGTLFQFDDTVTIAANMGATASVISGVNYSISNGLISFSGTGASTLTLDQKIQITVNAVSVGGSVAAFTNNSDTFVYHNGLTSSVVDSLVQLVGVNAAGVQTGANFTNNYVNVA